MPDCIHCNDSTADETIPRPDADDLGVCDDCWEGDRLGEDGLAASLADEDVLTPELVTELEARFYDATERASGGTRSEYSQIFMSQIPRTTTIRWGEAEDVAAAADIGTEGETLFGVRKWPGIKSGRRAYALLTFPPLETERPLYKGIFLAGESPEELDQALAALVDGWQEGGV